MSVKKFVSWEEMEILVDEMMFRIDDDALHLDGVVGIQRGGLVPAVMLSHSLGLPLKVLDYSSLNGRGESKTNQELPAWLGTGSWLIVDDISDSGSTLGEIMSKASTSVSAAIYVKSTSNYHPTYSGLTIDDDAWIEFPWES